MDNKLKALTRLLFGEEGLSHSIYSDTDRVHDLVDQYNKALELKATGVDGLKTKHISETVIAPLAFYGINTDKALDMVCVNLTPAYASNRIHLEKQAAGEHWQSYFDFYTSQKVMDFYKEDTSSYYLTMTKIIYGLYEDHDLGKIATEDLQAAYGVEKSDLLQAVMANKAMMFAHIVPFHSQGFDTNIHGINHLRTSIDAYDVYLSELLNHIKVQTKDKGIIMTNKFADAKVMHQLLADDGAESIINNSLISVQNWSGKWAIFFNDQPFTRYGLRSDLEIDTVICHLRDLMDQKEASVERLETYCQTLLDQRQAEDFKARGERIKKSKLKKLSVKKLRNTIDTPEEAPVAEAAEDTQAKMDE